MVGCRVHVIAWPWPVGTGEDVVERGVEIATGTDRGAAVRAFRVTTEVGNRQGVPYRKAEAVGCTNRGGRLDAEIAIFVGILIGGVQAAVFPRPRPGGAIDRFVDGDVLSRCDADP